jgi:hypothetical protein
MNWRYLTMKVCFAIAKALLRLVCKVCYKGSEIKIQSMNLIDDIDYTLRLVP